VCVCVCAKGVCHRVLSWGQRVCVAKTCVVGVLLACGEEVEGEPSNSHTHVCSKR
jgi:hypothetical protein